LKPELDDGEKPQLVPSTDPSYNPQCGAIFTSEAHFNEWRVV
jgi:hypothetical protein